MLGGLLVLWRRWLAWLHLPAAAWACLVEWMGWICPLTPLEIRYRLAAGGEGYDTSFIAHYLWPLIYPEQLTRETQWLLGLGVLLLNLVIYAGIYWHSRRRAHLAGRGEQE